MVIKSVAISENETTPEWYTPVTKELLKEITRRIVKECAPERVILFGSYAYGEPTIHSDVDLLVVSNKMRNKSVFVRDRRVSDIARAAIPSGQIRGMDILVRSPAELRYRLKIGDPFFREVTLKGTVLYRRRGSRYRFDAREWRNRMPEPVLVAEWIQKGEDDYDAAQTLLRQRKRPMPAMVCYHCQQSAEKYLKAFLLQHNVHFERTHELGELNDLCVAVDGTFQFITDWLKLLNPYAVETRYPGRVIEITEAREAVATAKQIRKFVRAKLGVGK
ncbi:MAG: HEPN domain-containing protein [Chloroflexi bacterium]|nr:HEPN domain-containing protein [Chloroflexota bacterium]